MAFYKIWSSRVKAPVNSFVGEPGLLFYDDTDGIIRIGDGETVGGSVLINSNLIGTGGGSGTTNGDVYIQSFPLNGSSVTVDFSLLGIENLLGFEILDSDNRAVEVSYALDADQLILDSNVNLVNHSLRIAYFK